MDERVVVGDFLKDPLERLVNRVSACLVREPKYYEDSTNRLKDISNDMTEVSSIDPEFICQLAYFTRNHLNLRAMSNYIVAWAASHPVCKTFLKKYFSHTIRLPGDLIEVVEFYQLITQGEGNSKMLKIPRCLREVITSKFSEFSVYHLGKYCSEGKRKRSLLKKNSSSRKGKISMKQIIRLCHVKSPASSVMCVLGKRYPENSDVFAESGLNVEGEFNPSLSGKRMKIETPVTWETQLSAGGNKPEIWESLIKSRKLPFMAMLRNIRNFIITGVDQETHKIVQDRLRDPDQIEKSMLFPFRFFSAYDVLKIDLEQLQKLHDDPTFEPPVPEGKRGLKKKWLRKKIIPKNVPTQATIDEYKSALEESVKLATALNVKPIKGHSVIFCDTSGSMRCRISGDMTFGSVRCCMELGILFGMMLRHVCESSQVYLLSSPKPPETPTCWLPVELEGDNILDQMQTAMTLSEKLGYDNDYPFDWFDEIIEKKVHIDNMFIFSDMIISTEKMNTTFNQDNRGRTVSGILEKYRNEVNPNMKYITIDLAGYGRDMLGADLEDRGKNIVVAGYSDAVLKLVSELQTSQVQAVRESALKIS
ncbi:unnamed protein product [Blepharisma stoltei]|uniref:TROVE domain-containing protein n=1 Tax=Blepharisma stoltei TaxID=1481888 RepID=A0AAU9KGB6_9CILI|nr:unnamed protein product [Blepharisma stoltei]